MFTTAGHVRPSISTAAPYTPRYALPLLLTTPVLVLAAFAWPTRGAVGHRVALVFLPLIAAVAWVLGPSPGPLGMRQIEGVHQSEDSDTLNLVDYGDS